MKLTFHTLDMDWQDAHEIFKACRSETPKTALVMKGYSVKSMIVKKAGFPDQISMTIQDRFRVLATFEPDSGK